MYLENVVGGLPYPLRMFLNEISHSLGMLLALLIVILVINPSGRWEGRQDRKASVHGSLSIYARKCGRTKGSTAEARRLAAVVLMGFNGSVQLEETS